MEANKQIVLFFEKFNKIFQRNEKYTFKELKSTQKNIASFIKKIENIQGKKTIGINFLFNYFSFQFYYYTQPGTLKSKRFLKLGHIINDKAVERWKNKTDKQVNDAIEWSAKNKIYIDDFKVGLDYTKKPDLFYIEEIERKRFFNTEIGLVHCLQLTSGYTEKSETCLKCNFSIECRELTA